jgi:glutamine phosphoribosylpyrophosphate amidotransferase
LVFVRNPGDTWAFDIIGAVRGREVQPGELVSLTERGIETRQVVAPERPAGATPSSPMRSSAHP